MRTHTHTHTHTHNEHFIMTSIGKITKISHYYMHKLNAILNTLKIPGESGRYYIILYSKSS